MGNNEHIEGTDYDGVHFVRYPNPRDLDFLISAVIHLYFLSLGNTAETVYRGAPHPSFDESELLNLVEQARNEWRSIRGSRRQR